MLAHTVLIITSGLAGKAPPDSLDRAIKQLVWMKKSPILILGADGDSVLGSCSMMDSCEIVFDPNDAGPFSPVKAGLHATAAAAFVWHMDQRFPTAAEWSALEAALRVLDDSSVEALSSVDVPVLLLTRTGGRRLKELPSDSAWPIEGLSVRVV